MSTSLPPEDQEFPQEPHNTLSTPLGRLIEGLTYGKIALAAILVIASSAVYFWMAAGSSNGLSNHAGKEFGEALYFSIVTFTTVGYGDLLPTGWGRLVVSVEVMIGLCLTALFIGKVASERQSALLLLIYTSDQQRRLSGFSDNLERFTVSIKTPASMRSDTVDNCLSLATSLQAYLMFQSHQGRLADFGNGSALRQLYRTMYAFLDTALDVFTKRALAINEEKVLFRVANRIARIASIMGLFHKDDGVARATIEKISLKYAKIKNWEEKGITCQRLEEVFFMVPAKPWPQHFHKEAAAKLGISNSHFSECIDELKKMGRI